MREHVGLFGGVGAALLMSAINPFDWATWFLEVMPILIGLPILILIAKSFPFSPLLYRLLFVHALILIMGAHYSYSRVPLGFWIQDLFDLSRNHYDRLGHFMQGFVPAILVRELLLRTSPLQQSKWLAFLTVSVCLAFSAAYELMEFLAAGIGGAGAEAFLGTQGDVWDTQWDMLIALVGAIVSLLVLTRQHERSMQQVVRSTG